MGRYGIFKVVYFMNLDVQLAVLDEVQQVVGIVLELLTRHDIVHEG